MDNAPRPLSGFPRDDSATRAAQFITNSKIAETWQRAHTLGDKLVLIGGAVALLSFVLPWMTINGRQRPDPLGSWPGQNE